MRIRALLLVVVLVGWASDALAQTFVQRNQKTEDSPHANPLSAANGDADITSGNQLTIVFVASSNTATVTTVASSPSNTWVLDAGPVRNGARSLWVYHANNVASGGTTVTVTMSAVVAVRSVLMEHSGLTTANSFDKTASATGSSTTPASGSTATTAQANELLIAGFSSDGNGPTATPEVVSPTWTSRLELTTDNIYVFDRTVTSAGAYAANCTYSPSTLWGATIVTYKSATAGGATTPRMLTHGVGPQE